MVLISWLESKELGAILPFGSIRQRQPRFCYGYMERRCGDGAHKQPHGIAHGNRIGDFLQ